MNIQGSWTGVIVYGKGYREHRNKELYFDIEIKQDGEKIYAESVDTGGVGVSTDIALIEGLLSNNKIRFIKQYTHLHYYDNDETVIDKSQQGHLIEYSGEFDEMKQHFIGKWIIRQKGWFLGIIPLHFNCIGTWTMRRK